MVAGIRERSPSVGWDARNLEAFSSGV
jgi:hypothetical protein